MSFSKTTQQVYDQTKTVTRRCGWWFLKPGDRLWAVEKAMGLKKGEKVKRMVPIEVVSVRKEPLCDIAGQDAEVIAEGFPDMTPGEFVVMFCKLNNCGPCVSVNRIEFKYLEAKS